MALGAMARRARSVVVVAAVASALYGAGCAWSLEGFTGGPEPDGAPPPADVAVEDSAAAEAGADAGAADAPAAFLSIDPPVDATGGTFDLTALGGLDWEQWRQGRVSRCAPCAQRIGTLVTAAPLVSYTDDPRRFKWTNGTPVATGSVTEGIYIVGVGHHFDLPIDATPTPSVLSVQVDTFYAGATFSAQIDGVGLGAKQVVIPPLKGPVLYAINVHFYAPAGSSLHVAWSMTADLLDGVPDAGDTANIAIIAATLAADP
ncbi:MAG: hypothetical protein JWP87_3626 [Labilithrix sp.]|nr:hypothetical protein [Labilithrix sp.]